MNKWFLMILLMGLNACAFAQAGILHEPISFSFVGVQPVQNKVQAFKGNGQQHIAYEFLVTNSIRFPIRITALNIQGKECKHSCALFERSQSPGVSLNPLQSLDPLKFDLKNFCKSKETNLKKCRWIYSANFNSQELPSLFSLLAVKDLGLPQDPLLQPNETGILFLFLDFPNLDQVPDVLVNSIDIEIQVEGSPPVSNTITSNHFIKIDKSSPIILDHPPLKGDKWLVANGPSNFSAHRRAIYVLNGDVDITQRFAVDMIKYGPEGLYAGDPLDNQNWYDYGSKVFAVADGTVFKVVDGVPNNTPGSPPPVITPENAAGNSVILKLDSGHYALYAHMISGSLQVKKGERVSAGQQIGSLGNSGPSFAPHLHFQISTRPERVPGLTEEPFFLASQGIPWTLKNFTQLDYLPIGQDAFTGLPLQVEITGKTKIKKQILMQDNLVSFR